jgi:hypothetical protein
LPQSAMSTLGSSTPSDDLDDGLGAEAGDLLRELVVAGPASGLRVSPALRAGLLGRIVDTDAIAAALEGAGHVDARRRDLPGEVTAVAVLNLCLYSGEGYDTVLKRTFGQLPGNPARPGAVAGPRPAGR